MKKTELLNKIATLLGGRASEEIIFGDISTGAHNDLAKATDIARSMVKEYGMSDTVGRVYFGRERRTMLQDFGFPSESEYSDATSEMIDREIKQIIDEQYSRAMEILRDKEKVLNHGAAILLKKEKIESDEIIAIMEGKSLD